MTLRKKVNFEANLGEKTDPAAVRQAGRQRDKRTDRQAEERSSRETGRQVT